MHDQICDMCGDTLPITEFAVCNKRETHVYRRKQCKTCYKAKRRAEDGNIVSQVIHSFIYRVKA